MALSQIETASLSSALVAPTATALTTASGSAPSYSARAWVNFNGTGTVAIRASGNCSSVTDLGTGAYTVNFSTAILDANYSAVCTSDISSAGASMYINTNDFSTPRTTTAFRIIAVNSAGSFADVSVMAVSIFR